MKINNLYDAVYYINLDSRTDRLRKFWDYNQKFLDQEKTIRITACDAKNTCAPKVRNGKLAPGDMQSLMMARTAHAVSYSKAFIDALANGYKKIFIFEDDAEPLFEDIETFFFYESEAEKMGYDMFYAGGQIEQDIEPAGNYLYKMGWKSNSHCFYKIKLNDNISKNEIINSFKKVRKKITKKNFETNLYTKNIPNPDILVRTGGHQRLSNFLLWQLAYTELFFLKKLWPDFTSFDLLKIINKYKKTKRNFGGI